MARGGNFQFSSSSSTAAVVLAYSDVDGVTGSADVSDNGDNLDITVPSGSLMSTLSAAPDLLSWDTGHTVETIRGRSYGMRVSSITAPSGSGAQIVLCYGLAFASAAAFNRSSDKSVWNLHHIGRSTDANTRSRHITRSNNASATSAGTQLDNFSSSQLLLFNTGDDKVGNWLMRVDPTSGTPLDRTGSNTNALTSSHKVLAFLAFGLSGTEASDQDISLKLEFLPPGTDWSTS